MCEEGGRSSVSVRGKILHKAVKPPKAPSVVLSARTQQFILRLQLERARVMPKRSGKCGPADSVYHPQMLSYMKGTRRHHFSNVTRAREMWVEYVASPFEEIWVQICST